MHDLKAGDAPGCLFAKELSVLESKSAAGSPPYPPQRRCRVAAGLRSLRLAIRDIRFPKSC